MANGCPRGSCTEERGSDTALCLSQGKLWARKRLELPGQKALGVWNIRLRRHPAGPCSPGRKGVTSRRHIVSTLDSVCMLARQNQLTPKDCLRNLALTWTQGTAGNRADKALGVMGIFLAGSVDLSGEW